MHCNSPTVEVRRSPPAPSARPFLLFMRPGASPKAQRRWILSADRNYDIMASFYARPEGDCWLLDAADYVAFGGLSKFHAAKLLLEPSLVARYRGIWLIDDDLETHFEPGKFLRFVDEQGFAIAQPALTHDSFASFAITLVHPTCAYRETTFVETMAPYFARETLSDAIVEFDRTLSTWGLDFQWSTRFQARRLAIVDMFTMTHIAAVDLENGAFYRYLKELGVDPWDELARMFAHLGLDRFEIANPRLALITTHQPAPARR